MIMIMILIVIMIMILIMNIEIMIMIIVIMIMIVGHFQNHDDVINVRVGQTSTFPFSFFLPFWVHFAST